MSDWKLGAVESRFADLIWQGEPMTSTQLVRRAEEALGWKKSTTYTVLKRLCQRGIFQNQDGVVTALVSKEEFCARQSEEFVEEASSGSLPAFLTPFTRPTKLSQEEITQLQQLIDESRG